ncbi:NTPase [Squirrelpox virus]|uniref:NTPase n=2 Tax=Squirrelpox virus TaxID=240426 RepID=U3UBI5_9POXV|nr:NTPase [Squirrelpox virus]CCD83259.1 NTPase [Squirrelpox virus]
MPRVVEDNKHIFVLKRLGVPSSCRQREDSRFVEVFTCEELERFIANNPKCTLFETLRDEEMYSVVRVFVDVDLDTPMDGPDFLAAIEDLILELSAFVGRFAARECGAQAEEVVRLMRSNFSLTQSTDADRTSFHLIFPDAYTTMETLIAMKRPMLEFARSSDNPLIKAIDTAVYRHKATMRVVGTRKTPDDERVHRRQPPHEDISDYLFTYVDLHENSCYFCLERRPEDALPDRMWDPGYMAFKDAMRRVTQVLVNEIVNLGEITEDNFATTPLVIDYVAPCALCRKRSHKHPHQLSLGNGALRIFKAGNPHSCKVKVIMIEGNRLFTIAQRIVEANVIHFTERGDYIVWMRGAWRFNTEEPSITKLVLGMRDSLPGEYGPDLLCPRKRKVVESNIRDMLVDPVDTDTHADKLPFSNGVMDLPTGTFHTGDAAKEFLCTVSTGYRLPEQALAPESLSPALEELERIIDDIQPPTPENAENRALYERTLSSCLCGTTKPCLVFFFGETATGKSTTKRLLISALGGLYIETGQSILTEIMDKGPNPFVANMHLKRAVFCSELPDFACSGAKKIRADNIKKLTEPCIVGRPCFSNRINNRNHATIVIDTNYKPVFDRVDNALMRRVALVRFRTHFATSNDGGVAAAAAAKNEAYDDVKPLDESLDRKIQRNYFRFAFLHLLVRWYQRHHVPALRLEATPDAVPDFAFQRRVGSLLIPSGSAHVPMMPELAKLGYVLVDGAVGLPAHTFQQRLANHFNARAYGHDMESFVARHKKFGSSNEEYLEYIFIEDVASK